MKPSDKDKRRERAYRRLGTRNPICSGCGEDDWRTLERHHVAEKRYDEDSTVTLCRNCHRKVTDSAKDHPKTDEDREPSLLESWGRWLLGFAEILFELVVEKMREVGAGLIEAAPKCPPPYGFAEVTR